MEQAAQGTCGISIHRDTQKSARQDLDHHALVKQAGSNDVKGVPSNITQLVIMQLLKVM